MKVRTYGGAFAHHAAGAHIASIANRVETHAATTGHTSHLRAAKTALGHAAGHLQQGAVTAARSHADAAARRVAAHRAAVAPLAPPSATRRVALPAMHITAHASKGAPAPGPKHGAATPLARAGSPVAPGRAPTPLTPMHRGLGVVGPHTVVPPGMVMVFGHLQRRK